MPAIARIGDPFTDNDLVATGSGDVFVNNIPAARLSDLTAGHVDPGHGFYPPAPIIEGSGSVFVNNLAVARVDDAHAVHCDINFPHKPPPDCHDGTISAGSSDVFADS